MASQTRQAILHHIVRRSGSVMELPPDADETGNQQLHSEQAQGQTAGESKPGMGIDSIKRGHPGPKMSLKEITSRDQGWIDIGSGMVSRVFVGNSRTLSC